MEEKKDFEQNIDNAKVLLEKLNDPEIKLEDSIKIYKEGLAELESASKLLEEAKQVFETATKD
jgi:exodeoxyribonuclease VII small subunit